MGLEDNSLISSISSCFRKLRGCVLQIDLKNGKIWIQHDGTEIGVANELVEWGVPNNQLAVKTRREAHPNFHLV